jgi:hypothetical protein
MDIIQLLIEISHTHYDILGEGDFSIDIDIIGFFFLEEGGVW